MGTGHKIGLIGYGGFGRFLHESWSQIGGVAIGAVSDVNPAADPGDIRFYADWRQLVTDPEIDIVAVATPPSLHAGMTIAALENGKHVLVEKPVAKIGRAHV